MEKNEFEIMLNNESYKVIVKRKKIKNTYIRYKNDHIEVNTNRFVSDKQITDLINNNQNKIRKMINNKKTRLLPNQIYYLGNIYQVVLNDTAKFAYAIKEDVIFINCKLSFLEAIDLFYKEEAKKILPNQFKQCYEIFTKYYGVTLPVLTIRKMSSRFGTCYYTKNKVCLNSYLVKYNYEVINYVIYHELCHLIHHNHSKQFYELLGLMCPNHKSLRNAINKF